MSTGAIIAIIVGVLILLAVIALLSRSGRQRKLEANRHDPVGAAAAILLVSARLDAGLEHGFPAGSALVGAGLFIRSAWRLQQLPQERAEGPE